MTLRQHLETAWQATGVKPGRLADAPELPHGCADLWRTFLALRASSPGTGFGPSRISFTELDAYQRTMSDNLEHWEVQAIRAADGAYIEVWSEARE